MKGECEHLPECWDDDERMGYLFSGFRGNRQVNPRDWDNKLKFWSDAVLKMGRTQRTLIFSFEDLSQKFRRKRVVPLCLGGVLTEMYRGGQIVRVDDMKASETWLSWGVNTLVRRPLRWTLNSLFQRADAPPAGDYVAVELLKEFGEALLERHHQSVRCSSTDHVVDYSIFKKECADLCKDDASFDLTLQYLQQRKQVLVTVDDNTKVIKFAAKGQKAVMPVTSTEVGTLRLKKTIISMQVTIERLSAAAEQEDRETRQYLRLGKKSSAKKALRRKKQAEKRLEKTETTLDTLQQLQDKLQSSESEKMVLDAYRSGAEALKKTFADNGLTPEAVDDTISDVQEVMEMCNELDDAIVAGNQTLDDTANFGIDVDIDSLESELEALIGGDGDSSSLASSDAMRVPQATGDRSPVLPDLPDVPPESPAALDRSRQEESFSQERVLAS